MKKNLKIAIGVFLILAIILAVRIIFGGPEDSWICQDGRWVKHGNPAGALPTEECK